MIYGTVLDNGVPTITLSIADQYWQATIDTGFNGDLELPEVLRHSLNARYVGKVISALAGGQTIEEDVYLINFPFDGSVISADVTLENTFWIKKCRNFIISKGFSLDKKIIQLFIKLTFQKRLFNVLGTVKA